MEIPSSNAGQLSYFAPFTPMVIALLEYLDPVIYTYFFALWLNSGGFSLAIKRHLHDNSLMFTAILSFFH